MVSSPRILLASSSPLTELTIVPSALTLRLTVTVSLDDVNTTSPIEVGLVWLILSSVVDSLSREAVPVVTAT
jgi:hypothetical protein